MGEYKRFQMFMMQQTEPFQLFSRISGSLQVLFLYLRSLFLFNFVLLQAMDPQFSVLLDDPTAGGDKCGKHKSDKTKLMVEILVPIAVFIVFLIAFLVVIWPRYGREE
jgi:hypothetical protein